MAHSPDRAENRRTLEDTKPCGHGRTVDVREALRSRPEVGTGQLIRLVNAGVAVHQPHFHGNHVWTMSIDNRRSPAPRRRSSAGHLRLQHWEDVVGVDPLQAQGGDAADQAAAGRARRRLGNQKCDFDYPMHCHAEMSQTAGGGLYPGGQVTDWIFKP